mmetsp:Transcript_7157/g.6247  ORF Transcript_7157/g.6247 Transcript_7157/m.6247 type:complete len:85 (+) Transcript_7157:334-588(+)
MCGTNKSLLDPKGGKPSDIKYSIMSTAASILGEESIVSARFPTNEKITTGYDTILNTEDDIPKVETLNELEPIEIENLLNSEEE